MEPDPPSASSSSSGQQRHRRSSFWDLFSPARSPIIRSRRKSSSGPYHAPRNWAVPAIRINSIDIGSSAAAYTGSLINLSQTRIGIHDDDDDPDDHDSLPASSLASNNATEDITTETLSEGSKDEDETNNSLSAVDRRQQLHRIYSFDDTASCRFDYYTSPGVLEQRLSQGKHSGSNGYMISGGDEAAATDSAQRPTGSGRTDESDEVDSGAENLTVPRDSTDQGDDKTNENEIKTVQNPDVATSLAHTRAKFIAKSRPRLLSHPVISTFSEIQTAPIGSDKDMMNPLDRELSRSRRASLAHGTSPMKLFFMPSYLMRRASQISTSGLVSSESMLSVTNKALVSYIQEDNFSGFESFLETRKGTLDDRDENGTSALMAAAQRGRVKFVKSLVEHGADINAEDADNWTPLLFATKEGHEDIAVYLLDHGATVDHRDMGGWTALMWACYKGRVKAARKLIEKGADVNAYGNYNVSCLGWAAGRNHVEIAKDLIQNGAKVNAGDKYGTTPLIWAARKGNLEIVQALLKAGSMVDACGMTSWTALLVATAGSHVEVVKALLEYRPNVNALDKDACSALTIACKEGFHEIALSLVNAGAYININDRGGSSNLIHAAKGGHRSIVDALLKKHADVNVQGKDRKTALYWAVEKSHVGVVKSILAANPDLELATKDGDTPLMRAVRNRNLEIVSLLLDKRAKVNTADRNGDTCLHIAMRARSKQIAELFLRNPVNSQLLYRPNRAGETPYNIDRSSAKPVITQLFGSRGLNTQEDFENLLGYNLYSSALADMLSDPTLNMPITIGLFARWGSGKSFLLSKLKEEMKSFARQWFNPVFIWSVLLFVVVLWLAVVMGVILGLSLWSWKFGLGFAAGIVILVHTFLFVVWFCSERSKYEWTWSHKLASFIAVKMESLRLVLQVVFCHPAGSLSNDNIQALPINFYFTEQAKISSTSGGENSLNQMLLSLYACLENDYGTFATRLFRAFRPKPVSAHASWRWRKLCCIPYWIISSGCFALTLVGIVVLCLFYFDNSGINQYTLVVIMYICATVVGLLVVANLYTIGQVLKAIVFSHKHHLQKAVNKINAVKSDGFLYAMKAEVNMLSDMARCLDSFTGRQSRMVVIVDGLDSGEQDKVLQVLDAVHILFSDNRAPFIILLAIDPHIISKGIEMNINPVLNDANVGGQDYLRNLVHLPFYLQNAALRKVKQVKMLETSMKKNEDGNPILSARRPSVESNMGLSLALDRYDKVASKKAKRLGLKMSDSIASSLGTNINKIGAGPGDLKKMLLGDDYFSDVNPRSMRRLMNIIHITGRLLKAFNFDFNWHHLSTWVNLTEQWPYRLSWLIIYCEVLQKELEDSLSLKTVFDRVRPFIPASKELDPNLGLDRDEKKLDVYLGVHKNSLLISTLYIFLPFTISLDPQLRKDITEQYQPNEQMFKQSPGSYKPAIQPPPSPYMNPNYNHSLRYRQLQNARPQVSLSTTAVQSYYQPPVPSNPVSTYPNVWPFPPPVSSAFPPPVSAAFPPPVSSFFAPESLIGQELKSVRLSTLSVEGVCDMLAKLPSIKTTAVERYQETLRANNIGGRVLMCCDLSELKLVLGMTFGDWEIFKSAIITLRENATLGEMLSHRSEAMTETSVLINVTSPEKERQSSVASAQKNEMAEFRKTLKPNVLEKQITMEDQMITGALELLNDDAKEDARKGEEAGTSNATLSPVNSEPELANSRRTSKAFEEQDETDVLYVTGTSTNVTAELPDSPTILRRLESEKALFSLVNESIPPNSSYTDASSLEMPHPSSSQNPSPTVPASHPRHSAYQTPTPPHHSPARKRSSLKRTPVSRTQSSASNLSPSAVSHRRNRDDKSTGRQVPKTPEDERKKGGGGSKRVSSQPGFRIGSNSSSDVSSDESQTPLVSRGSAGGGGQIRKMAQRPSLPLEEPCACSMRKVRAYSMTTEDSSGQMLEQRPKPLPPFGSEEYYRIIKATNLSPTTSNESELGSSTPQTISSGENLFFPELYRPPSDYESSSSPGPSGISSAGPGPSEILSSAKIPTESGSPASQAMVKKSLITVLKSGSTETLLQKFSKEGGSKVEKIPLLPTSKFSSGPVSPRGLSFHGRSVAVRQDNADTIKTIHHRSDPVLWVKGHDNDGAKIRLSQRTSNPGDAVAEEEIELEDTNNGAHGAGTSSAKEIDKTSMRLELHLNSNGSHVVHSPICTDETTALVGGPSQRESSDEAHC